MNFVLHVFTIFPNMFGSFTVFKCSILLRRPRAQARACEEGSKIFKKMRRDPNKYSKNVGFSPCGAGYPAKTMKN